ncbi:MAG: VWA domain-containing protein [Aridibacter sp.]
MNKIKIKILYLSILLIIFANFPTLSQEKVDKPNSIPKQKLEKLNLVITDKEGNFISDLNKDEISLFIDGKEQPIETLEMIEKPLIYILSIDNSGSLRFEIDEILKSAKSLVSQNNENDLAALMRFISRDKIQITDKFTSDKKYLHSYLDLFKVEGGQTALVDAIYKSVQLVAEQTAIGNNYRRAVIVISDGEERNSDKSEKDLVKLLEKENVQVIFISLVELLSNDGNNFRKSPRKKAEDFIEKVSEESGGFVITPKETKQLSEMTENLISNLRNQYTLSFLNPANSQDYKVKLAKTSKRKKLKFSVHK